MSIPILYESGTTDFWNMGLGPLSDTLEATVTEQRNGEFYLDLSYPIDGARANELKNNRIIVADAGHSLKAQQFDITDVQRGLTKLTVHAEHASYRTSRYPLTPTFKYTGNADGAIRAWQKAIVVDNNITADSDISTTGTVNLTIDKAQNARQVLGGVEGSILDVYGGEYRFDNEHISLLNHRGSVVNTLLAYGRNITDFNQEEAIGETYTSIYPYALVTKPGEDEATLITLPEYYVDGDYVKNFPQRRVLPVDLSSKFGDKNPTTVDGLRTAAKAYVKANQVGVPKVSTTISFVDLSKTTDYADVAGLEEVNLCDEVPFWFSKYDIRTAAKVSSVVWNVLSDSYNSITLGDLAASLSESIQTIATQTASQEASKAIITVLQGADGLTNNFYSDGVSTSPTAKKIGDRWFAKNGDKTSLYIWDGVAWREVVSTDTADKIAADIDAKLVQLNADMSAADDNLQAAKQDVADLQVKLKANDDTQAQLKNDLSENSTILAQAQVDIVANTQSLSDLDTKLKANDDIQSQLQTDLAANTKVQDQLKTDLAANSQLVTQNKADVDAALKSVNETLTQAQTDTATAVKNAYLAVTTAQSAVDASGLATQTANAANDAATAAKNLATSTANSFATVQSQAATAANDAATALDQAKSALDTANGVSDNYISIKQIVDDTSGTIKTLATSASVDAVSGRVTAAQSLAEQTANGLTLKADSSTVDTINDTVKQQGIDLKAAQDQLALKLTQSDLTQGLDGYATQTWAQNQITASAKELSSTMTTVQTQVQNSAVGTNVLLKTGTPFSMTGNNTLNQRDYGYSLANGYNVSSLASALGTQFTISFDWSVSGDSPSGSFKAQYTSVPWTYTPSVTVSSSNTSGHVSGPFNVSTDSANIANAIGLRLDNFVGTITISNVKLEKGSVATDWCPNPADNATVTALSSLSQTVDGLTGTFAKKTDLESTESDLKVTAEGLNLITSVTGPKGENVTQVIADVKNIKTTMTGENGYTTRLQTLEGFQQTATKQIAGKAETTQVTQLATQITSVVGGLGQTNLVYNSDVKNNTEGWSTNSSSCTIGVGSNQWEAANGSNSLSIHARQGIVGYWYHVSSKPFTPAVGQTYSASAVLFVTGSDAPTATVVAMGIDFYDANGNRLDYSTTQFDISNPWEKQTLVSSGIVAPSTASSMMFSIWFTGAINLMVNHPMLVADEKVGSYQPDTVGNSQITQLQNQIDLRTTVAGKVTAALNLSNDGGGTVTIRGASLYVTADSHFDAASIQSAAIANLDAKKITSGSISSDRLATTKLNADNITSGSISADRLATTKLNASNITSGSINAGLITTGVLSADMIVGGTFDASKMTVKNINADSITSGSIATALLASTKINADNIASGSIAAERLAATKISATNIVGGTFDAGTMTVKNLSADMIASGTIDASLLSTTKLNATNITAGTLDLGNLEVKNLNASLIVGGELDASTMNVINLNAASITSGYINADRIGTHSLSVDKISDSSYNYDDTDIAQDGRKYSGSWSLERNHILFWGHEDGAYNGYFSTEYGGDVFKSRLYSDEAMTQLKQRIDISASQFQMSENWAGPGSIIRGDGTFTFGNLKWNGFHSFYSIDAGDYYFHSSTDDNTTKLYAKDFVKSSRLSLKDIVGELDEKESLDTLIQTDIRLYRYKEGDNQVFVGPILDDVHDLPEYNTPGIFADPTGEGVTESNITGYLVQAVKYLSKRLKELEGKISE